MMSLQMKIKQNGFEWLFDPKHVAENRAKYYAEKDPDTTYQEEYDFTINDQSELYDWFMNNMNISDLPEGALTLCKQPVSLDKPDQREDFEVEIVHA